MVKMKTHLSMSRLEFAHHWISRPIARMLNCYMLFTLQLINPLPSPHLIYWLLVHHGVMSLTSEVRCMGYILGYNHHPGQLSLASLRVAKSSAWFGWGKGGKVVAVDNTVWSHMVCDSRSGDHGVILSSLLWMFSSVITAHSFRFAYVHS